MERDVMPPTRTPKPPVIPEREVQANAIRILAAYGCKVHRRNTGATTAEYKGKSRFIRYSEPGSADLWFLTSDGVHGELEVKRLGERPSLDQVKWLMEHNGIGRAVAFWVDNTATLDRVMGHVLTGGRIVYSDETRVYTVKRRGTTVRLIGPSGDYDLG
jgi:hypothetical protein